MAPRAVFKLKRHFSKIALNEFQGGPLWLDHSQRKKLPRRRRQASGSAGQAGRRPTEACTLNPTGQSFSFWLSKRMDFAGLSEESVAGRRRCCYTAAGPLRRACSSGWPDVVI